MSAFPPTGPTCLTQQIRAFVYKQFEDDDNIQAFNSSFNVLAQNYLSWFVNINLPIYTGLSGALLDWVAQGLYGISRPALPYGSIVGTGLINTWKVNTILVNSYTISGEIDLFVTTDDIFKRIITWFFFKGDGQVYSITWLKRRIMRFLIGINGVSPNIDNTYPISVACSGNGEIVITITLTNAAGIVPLSAQIFQAAAASGAISLPFQYSFSVSIINGLTGLYNEGGVLCVFPATGYPIAGSLPGGSIYSNGGVVSVVPGGTHVAGSPIYFGITATALLALGGLGLPWTAPLVGSGQLWVPGGALGGDVWIA
jgi:hypothetical protein